MSKEDFDDELIDKYLDEQMDQEERRFFEEQMTLNPDLAEEVALQRDIRSGVDFFEYKSLKEELNLSDMNVMARPGNHNANNGRRLYTWVAVAASFIAFIVLGYWLLEKTESPQALVSSYYQRYPNVLNPVDRSASGMEDPLAQALHAYESGEYQQAVTLFEQNEEQMSEGHLFYLAMSYFELDQAEQSIMLLNQVIRKKDPLFYFPALWYQALAYLAMDHTQPAKDNLKILTEEENSYQQEAYDLLQELGE